MDNQHRKITGYRELSQAEIDLMNRIKAQGVELEKLVNDVQQHVSEQYGNIDLVHPDNELDRINGANPLMWLPAAKVDLQVGLMKLTRAVAQPTTF